MLGLLVVIVFGLIMVYNASRLSDYNLVIAVGSYGFILYLVISDMIAKRKEKKEAEKNGGKTKNSSGKKNSKGKKGKQN